VATTNFREDWLGRDLIAPTTNALDFLGRSVTATTGYVGTSLRRGLRTNTTAVTLGQEIQFVGGEKFVVTIAGTTAGAPPTAPAIGATVVDGGATLRRER
jgi:hypothetical protein